MIKMRVKVPRELAGGSLLKAHQWVKSNVAKTNPGRASNDYTLQAVDGTPISLSDLTSRTFDEVLVVSGTKNNPGQYPVPEESWGYPTYKSKNRLGNKVTTLLAKDIDPSMIERIAAQNGMFSALNTVTKLLYTSKNNLRGTDTKVAALLQTYANASAVKNNPGRPFFATDINNKFRGVVSPQEATRSFIAQEFGVDPSDGVFDANSEASTYLIDKARIIRMYDLANPDTIEDFMDNVLFPFLAISTANAKMLKAMKHQDYNDMTRDALTRGRKDSDSFDIRWQKLISMVPTKAEQFYDGMDYALVAHPLFMSDSLGIAAMNRNLIRYIANTVRDYPGNANRAVSSIQRREFATPLQKFLNMFRPEDGALYEMMQGQTDILRAGTTAEETLAALQSIYNPETIDIDIAKYTANLETDRLVGFFRDVAGFKPTPPPYWPKPVVLAMMDALRNNINAVIINEQLNFGGTFMSHLTRGKLPAQYWWLQSIQIQLASPETLPKAKNEVLEGIKYHKRSTKFGKVMEELYPTIEGQTYADQLSRTPGNPYDISAKKFSEIANKLSDYIDRIKQDGKGSLSDTVSPTIHILSVFMEIEDTSRSKYNYTMSENDRAFTLYMLQEVFNYIDRNTPGSLGELRQSSTPADNANILNILQGYTDTVPTVNNKELTNRIEFETGVQEIWYQVQALLVGSDPGNVAVVQKDAKDELLEYRNGLPEEWRRIRIDTLIDTINDWRPAP